jgi:hypothetical protein
VTIPNWFELLVVVLAALRTWRLLAEDDILNRPRRYVTGLGSTWKEGDPPPKSYRFDLAEFLSCPWCLGAWCGIGWWGAFQLSPHWATLIAVPFAISALVPLLNRATGD